MRRVLLFVLLISGLLLLPSRTSVAAVKDNDLTFDSDRLSQDKKKSLGEQSKRVTDLFGEEDTQKLSDSKNGKAALSSQQRELFQKGRAVTTSSKQKNGHLFQSSVSHSVSLRGDQQDDQWNLANTLIYTAVILLSTGIASAFTYRFSKSKEEIDNAIY
ncbi:type VII secretion protein EssA [Streptococcus macacae]|nr:type VII secretion protein EssA [Streptococcus macacae]SUN77854.1 type VII secretion protein EssA [Streptococcus macacae NCTC 11558]